MNFFDRLGRLFGRVEKAAAVVEAVQELRRPVVKTGEQVALMSDPQGRRVYHEYFVGDDRGDGHFPWQARVYSGTQLVATKDGLASSRDVASDQAVTWALKTKQAVLGAP